MKKLTSALLITALALTLAACSADNEITPVAPEAFPPTPTEAASSVQAEITLPTMMEAVLPAASEAFPPAPTGAAFPSMTASPAASAVVLETSAPSTARTPEAVAPPQDVVDKVDRRAEVQNFIQSNEIEITSHHGTTMTSDTFPWNEFFVPRHFISGFELREIEATDSGTNQFLGSWYSMNDDINASVHMSYIEPALLLEWGFDAKEYKLGTSQLRENGYSCHNFSGNEVWHILKSNTHGFAFLYNDISVHAWISVDAVPDLSPQQIFERYLSDMVSFM